MTDCILPPPWRRSKGKLRKAGYVERPFEEARLMHDPAAGVWWLAVPRSREEPSCYDLWGNWRHPTDREEDVVPKAEALYARLLRARWMDVGTRWGERRIAVLMRMARGPEMPAYFVSAYDRKNLSRGRAATGARIRVAGFDVSVEKEGLGGAFALSSSKRVTIAPAGGAPGVRAVLERDEAQALSDWFGSLAAGTLDPEASQALLRARSDASHRALGVPSLGPTPPSVRERNRTVGSCMDAVAANMAAMDVNALRMLRLVSEALARGDAIGSLHVVSRERAAQGGVNVKVDAGTATAAMPPEGLAVLADIVSGPAEAEGPGTGASVH